MSFGIGDSHIKLQRTNADWAAGNYANVPWDTQTDAGGSDLSWSAGTPDTIVVHRDGVYAITAAFNWVNNGDATMRYGFCAPNRALGEVYLPADSANGVKFTVTVVDYVPAGVPIQIGGGSDSSSAAGLAASVTVVRLA